jgi:hypothetical protein
VYGISRNVGDALVRDFNYTKDATFAVDLTSGEYDVIVTLGDMAAAHDQMGVFLEGVPVDTVSTTSGQTVARTYRVSVGDGQLNLRLADLGGSDAWVMINALDVVAVGGGAQSGASAVALVEPSTLQSGNSANDRVRSRRTRSVLQRPSFDRGQAQDLINVQLSALNRRTGRDASNEARDAAVSELFAGSDGLELKRNRFVEDLLAWDEAIE